MSIASPVHADPITSEAPADDVMLRRTTAHDIDHHVDQLQDWNLRYDQLDCGRFEGAFTDIRWPGMQLFIERTTRRIRQRGHLMPSSLGVACLLEGQGDIAVNAVRAGQDSMILCDSTELDICTPAQCMTAGIVVDTQLLYEAAERSGTTLAMRPGALLSITPPEPALRRWREILSGATATLIEHPDLLQQAAVRDRLGGDLLGALIDSMASVRGDEPSFGPDQRKRIVDRACEMLLSSPENPPTLAEVCHRVGASPRKLEYCFRDVLGLSPAKYVKSIRLNAVRRELAHAADPSLSVYDVAARWGFWHFGHFSTDYKRQFAELPSETLRRARLP